MLPGPNLIYECPTCKNLLVNKSLLSGNNISEIIFSDGKIEAFLCPNFPVLTKCSRCCTFLWLSKIEKVERKLNYQEQENAERVQFLTIYEYLTVLECTDYNDEEERFIRQRILWEFNDRVRNKQTLFNSNGDKIIWERNINKLMSLVDCSAMYDDLLLYAELNRNLGKFEQSMYTLNTINRPPDDNLVNALRKECDNKNKTVFQFYNDFS